MFRGEEDSKILVRLHTISGNRTHPEAAVPELSVPISSGNYDRAFIQIFDDVVGMFFWMHDPALVIWNWRTGKIVVVREQLYINHPDCSANLVKLELRRVRSPLRHIRLLVPLQPRLYGHHDRRRGWHRDIHVQRRRRRLVFPSPAHARRPIAASPSQAGPRPDPLLHALSTVRRAAHPRTSVRSLPRLQAARHGAPLRRAHRAL